MGDKKANNLLRQKNVETLRPDTNGTLDTRTLDYFYTEYIIKHGLKKNGLLRLVSTYVYKSIMCCLKHPIIIT